MRPVRLFAGLLSLLFAVACAEPAPQSGVAEMAAEDPALVDPDRVPVSDRVTIVFLGDSLTAGLGLMSDEAYPSRIGEMFANEGYWEVEILNAGLSGDTTAGGLRRIGPLLTPGVGIVVVALGGNDALRGLTVSRTYDNLAAIIDQALAAGCEVLLAGMEGPTNLGEDYRAAFRDVFVRLARDYGRNIYSVPFLLEGVAGLPRFNQADGIHPNAEGARRIAEHLYPTLRGMVDVLPGVAR